MSIAIALIGALALAGGQPGATDDKSATGSNPQTPAAGSTTQTPAAGSNTQMSGKSSGLSQGASAANTGAPVSGDIVSTDPSALVSTVLVQSGDQQQVRVADNAQITRGGSQVAIIALQPG